MNNERLIQTMLNLAREFDKPEGPDEDLEHGEVSYALNNGAFALLTAEQTIESLQARVWHLESIKDDLQRDNEECDK